MLIIAHLIGRPVADVHPKRAGRSEERMLYTSTEHGCTVSFAEGTKRWLRNDLVRRIPRSGTSTSMREEREV